MPQSSNTDILLRIMSVIVTYFILASGICNIIPYMKEICVILLINDVGTSTKHGILLYYFGMTYVVLFGITYGMTFIHEIIIDKKYVSLLYATSFYQILLMVGTMIYIEKSEYIIYLWYLLYKRFYIQQTIIVSFIMYYLLLSCSQLSLQNCLIIESLSGLTIFSKYDILLLKDFKQLMMGLFTKYIFILMNMVMNRYNRKTQ